MLCYSLTVEPVQMDIHITIQVLKETDFNLDVIYVRIIESIISYEINHITLYPNDCQT